jgi:hypothetical protein
MYIYFSLSQVVAGSFTGRTGRVVHMYQKDGASLAVVITDGVNNEIQCNVGALQVCVHILIHTNTYTYIHILIHIHTHINTHTYTHTHIHT